ADVRVDDEEVRELGPWVVSLTVVCGFRIRSITVGETEIGGAGAGVRRRMGPSRSRGVRGSPPPACFSGSGADPRPTRLIQDAPVGVKCTWKRGCRSSQRWMAGVLWVL